MVGGATLPTLGGKKRVLSPFANLFQCPWFLNAPVLWILLGTGWNITAVSSLNKCNKILNMKCVHFYICMRIMILSSIFNFLSTIQRRESPALSEQKLPSSTPGSVHEATSSTDVDSSPSLSLTSTRVRQVPYLKKPFSSASIRSVLEDTKLSKINQTEKYKYPYDRTRWNLKTTSTEPSS